VALLAVHVVGYLAGLFWVLSPAQAVAFLVVHQGLLAWPARRNQRRPAWQAPAGAYW
jgi:hypothetical protein